MKALPRSASLSLLLALTVSCGGSSPAAGTSTPSAAAAEPAARAPEPAPSPSPSPPPPFDEVRVAFFGFSCYYGKPPRNVDRILPVRCRGFVTATPKYPDGAPVEVEVTGTDVKWELRHGEDHVRVEDSRFPNEFNRDLMPIVPGDFDFCATVRGVTGCLHGYVVQD